MIRELSELGKRLREENSKSKIVHDALKDEPIGIVLTIKKDGSFVSIVSIEKKSTRVEAVQRTNEKKPRLLVDNPGYVLGIINPDGSKYKSELKKRGEKEATKHLMEDAFKKNESYVSHLREFSANHEMQPVLLFYGENRKNGITKVTQDFFLSEIDKKDREANIAIYVQGDDRYLHEKKEIYNSIISKYEENQSSLLASVRVKCSICSSEKYPVGDYPHFPIKGVPGDKEPAGGRKLISYNGDNNPFESYNMEGNENSRICTQCAKTYVEGLNWLLAPQSYRQDAKNVKIPVYQHKKTFGDIAIVFWTKQDDGFKDMDLLDEPDIAEVSNLLSSAVNGNVKHAKIQDENCFYSCTLSGVAARVVIRDWIEQSLFTVKASIAQWFRDVEIGEYDKTTKRVIPHYPRLYDLAKASQRINKNGKYDEGDITISRVAVSLWKAALEGKSIPIWVLSAVLKRIKVDDRGITPERAALIRLIINRNSNGGNAMKESLDEKNVSPAYVCGRIFCVLENIQRAALGKTNAGIRERFFTSASTNPSSAFGRLLKMSQNHISKIKGDKPGLAVFFDKELQELFSKIESFPAIFSLEQQGQFAIGYYHQKHEISRKAAENNEEEGE